MKLPSKYVGKRKRRRRRLGAWVRSTYWKNADLEWLSWVVRFSASFSFDDDVLHVNRLFEIAYLFLTSLSCTIRSGSYHSYSRDWNELSSPPRITKLINGCVALPWHFEFYIVCKIFLINFLDEIGNFKQKKFTFQMQF